MRTEMIIEKKVSPLYDNEKLLPTMKMESFSLNDNNKLLLSVKRVRHAQ